MSHPSVPARPALCRPLRPRLVAGVCQGVADHLGLPVLVVRLVFVVLTWLNLAGLVLYAVLWAVIPQEGATRTPARHRGIQLSTDPRRVLTRLRAGDQDAANVLLTGLALLTVGGVIAATRLGLGSSTSILLPALVVLAGAALGLWAMDRTDPDGPRVLGSGGAVLRVAGGIVLVIIGVILALAPNLDPYALLLVTVSAAAVLAGVAMVLAPWALRLWRGLEQERRLRIRESERAEIAAHLHDSVLQTLALIQRRSHDGDQVARLARAQERELRAWLYSAPESATEEPVGLAAQVRRLCAQIEDDEGVPVDVVVVGQDEPADAATQPLLQALREGLLNAVRHGKVGVSVYLEISPAQIECFVRDRGPGFDLAAVPTDRLGVRESIIGRMERSGGSARVRAAPGGGTEVSLSLSRQPVGGSR